MRIKSGEIAIEADTGGKVYAEPALHLKEQSSTPSTAAGEGVVFVDQTDGNLKFRAASDGSVVDLIPDGISWGRAGVDSNVYFTATPGTFPTYAGVTGFPNSSVAGAPYVTFTVDGVNGDYLEIGSSGAGLYLIQWIGDAAELTANPAKTYYFAFSKNGTNQAPLGPPVGPGAGTGVPFSVSHQAVLTLAASDKIRLTLAGSSAGNLELGGEFVIIRLTGGGGGGAGSDSDAVHVNVANEIHAITQKATPVAADEVIIEDSAASWVKKRVALSAIPATDSNAIHDNVAGEIAAITEKASPVSADKLLIEDSAAADAKKYVQIGNLPGGGSLPVVYARGGNYAAVNFGVACTPSAWTDWSRLESALVTGAPYITFVNQLPGKDYFLIGASGGGVYFIAVNGQGYLTGAASADLLDVGIQINTTVWAVTGRHFTTASPKAGYALFHYHTLASGDEVSIALWNRDTVTRSFTGQFGLVLHRIGS